MLRIELFRVWKSSSQEGFSPEKVSTMGNQLLLISMEGQANHIWFQWQYRDSTLAVGIDLTQKCIVQQTSQGSCKISLSLVSSSQDACGVILIRAWKFYPHKKSGIELHPGSHVVDNRKLSACWVCLKTTFSYVEGPWMLLDLAVLWQRPWHTKGTVILNPDRMSSPPC